MQGVRNVSFSENCAYVLNERSQITTIASTREGADKTISLLSTDKMAETSFN